MTCQCVTEEPAAHEPAARTALVGKPLAPRWVVFVEHK
jgi:hypothetical protein